MIHEIASQQQDGDKLIVRTVLGETVKIPNTPLNQWHFRPGTLFREETKEPHPASIHARSVA